jgi:hypothetical protein
MGIFGATHVNNPVKRIGYNCFKFEKRPLSIKMGALERAEFHDGGSHESLSGTVLA